VWQIACVNQLTVRNIYFGAGADAEVANDGYGSTAVHSLSRGIGSSGWIPVLRRNGRQRRGRADSGRSHDYDIITRVRPRVAGAARA
jgi:hypothetical protein